MRKVYGIKSLLVYLESIDYPVSEERIHELISKKEIPHLRPISNMLAFNLVHIDWWVSEQRKKP